jgi:hydroxymethylbilane synthase
MKKKFIAGSRASKLALVQTLSVLEKLYRIAPDIDIELMKVTTTGDRDQSTSLDSIGPAAFVKELEQALLERRIDFAVHSLKDVPSELPPCLCLIATTERLSPADVLVAKAKLKELPPDSRIGTGSLRRTVQLMQVRPDLKLTEIRGNIDTRIRKVSSGEIDGIIIAAAALIRLEWQDKITEYLPLDTFLPAAGQGALVIEARTDDEAIKNMVTPLNHLPTWQSTTAERAFLSAVGSGCRAPVAVLGTVNGPALTLEAMVADIYRKETELRLTEQGASTDPVALGKKLARKMLDKGAARYINGAKDR